MTTPSEETELRSEVQAEVQARWHSGKNFLGVYLRNPYEEGSEKWGLFCELWAEADQAEADKQAGEETNGQ